MENEKRLIDAHKLIIAIQHFRWIGVPHTLKQMFQCLRIIINEQPTVDAVEVVRCKDCIYYEETLGKDSGKPCGYGSCGCTCQIITGIIYDEDFCSYGERKDNG